MLTVGPGVKSDVGIFGGSCVMLFSRLKIPVSGKDPDGKAWSTVPVTLFGTVS